MVGRLFGFAWLVCALALVLTSCVSSEELRREDEATCAGYGFHPGTDAFAGCLQKESWRAVTGLRRRRHIGGGVTGGAGPGDHIGLDERV
jgi:hypothetical protein